MRRRACRSRTRDPWSPGPRTRGPGAGTARGRTEGSGALTCRREVGTAEGVAVTEGDVSTTAGVATSAGPEAAPTRATPYPNPQVPASTTETMATPATRFPPAPIRAVS